MSGDLDYLRSLHLAWATGLQEALLAVCAERGLEPGELDPGSESEISAALAAGLAAFAHTLRGDPGWDEVAAYARDEQRMITRFHAWHIA